MPPFIESWLVRWSRNYALLRRAVDAVGRELARKPYESLLQPDELSFTQFVEGEAVDFEVEVYRIEPDGTIWARVETRSRLPTPFMLRPALVFTKHRDGMAYVQF
ncbi:MAG: hypothetical protein IT532_00785 [Burkholderiales bacterium]|nr:hypothetical protein [Burkholderiales bacterium]